MCTKIYEPREDSFLLEKYVKKYAYGKILDIGTGSGIQAMAAAEKDNVSSVFAVDIQEEAVQYCKSNARNKKIKFFLSDLFSIFNMKFDTIIFNPPYLPEDAKIKDLTIDGGKKGYELIERFLSDAGYFLKSDGIILLSFSSQTRKDKIEEFIRNNLLEFTELESRNIFFEKLYVYLIKKRALLNELEERNIKNAKYFAKGHRGIAFMGSLNNKKVIIKIKNPESKAIDSIINEAKWLKELNKENIGPKFIAASSNFLAYEYVDGDFILDCIKKSSKNNIIKILKKILNQLYKLDRLKINKEEMHHPYKHIIVTKNGSPIMIDFERCRKAMCPKNVTQFCQFLASSKMAEILNSKDIAIHKDRVIQLTKVYKYYIDYIG